MSNLYQMNIKVITTKGPHDENPYVTWITPDPDLNDYKFLPKGTVPDMVLVNYEDKHFNLIISKDSELLRNECMLENKRDESLIVENMEVDITDNDTDKSEKCKNCEKLSEKIDMLEEKLKDKSKEIVNQPNRTRETNGLIKTMTCNECDEVFVTKSKLRLHIQEIHENKSYNCSECSFQGSSENDLSKHVKVTQHKQNNDTFKCDSCDDIFEFKWDMMNHRKKMHEQSVRQCKFFAQGKCIFEDETCWYSHQPESNKTQHPFKCTFCDEVFVSKARMMSHRKTSHTQAKLFKCRNYVLGQCKFEENQCWYSHDVALNVKDPESENSICKDTSINIVEKDDPRKDNEKNSFFPKISENTHPPDVLMQIMNLVQNLSERLQNVETSLKTNI